MKEKVKKEPDIKKCVEKESLHEDHFEPFGMKGDAVFIAAIISFSSNYDYVTINIAYRLSNFQDSLIVTDAIND